MHWTLGQLSSSFFCNLFKFIVDASCFSKRLQLLAPGSTCTFLKLRNLWKIFELAWKFVKSSVRIEKRKLSQLKFKISLQMLCDREETVCSCCKILCLEWYLHWTWQKFWCLFWCCDARNIHVPWMFYDIAAMILCLVWLSLMYFIMISCVIYDESSVV